jgi:peptidoglycan/LPS O-acetylase OafA/YrhL
MLFICVFTVLLGAWLLNKLVEKPFLNRRDKVLRPKVASIRHQLAAISANEQVLNK